MKTLIILIIGIVVFVAFIRYFESRNVFYPSRSVSVTPASIGLPFEDVYFKTEDQVLLNGWFMKSPQSPSVLLCFHGNAGNLSHRLEKISMFHTLGINVFMIDYRGYGNSQGRPTEQGMYRDGLAALKYLQNEKNFSLERIVIYGDSLGGAAAVDLASQSLVAALIVDSSFTNAADMSRMIFPFVPTFLLKTKLDSISKVRKITIPKLFIHSANDEIVPLRLGQKLYEAAAEPKTFFQVTGGHNTNFLDSQDLWLTGINDFLKKLKLIY